MPVRLRYFVAVYPDAGETTAASEFCEIRSYSLAGFDAARRVGGTVGQTPGPAGAGGKSWPSYVTSASGTNWRGPRGAGPSFPDSTFPSASRASVEALHLNYVRAGAPRFR
jgi:hypothetical protein